MSQLASMQNVYSGRSESPSSRMAMARPGRQTSWNANFGAASKQGVTNGRPSASASTRPSQSSSSPLQISREGHPAQTAPRNERHASDDTHFTPTSSVFSKGESTASEGEDRVELIAYTGP